MDEDFVFDLGPLRELPRGGADYDDRLFAFTQGAGTAALRDGRVFVRFSRSDCDEADARRRLESAGYTIHGEG